MEKRKLGKTDIEVSAIALGVWSFGGEDWNDVQEKESIDTVHAALDNGINFIDTATKFNINLIFPQYHSVPCLYFIVRVCTKSSPF